MRVWLLLMAALTAADWTTLQASAHAADAPRRHQYDGVEGGQRRRTPQVNYRSEDDILAPGKRAKLQANARELVRNFSIASWAIRRHLDYVATFDFHARHDDQGLNRVVEEFITRWSRPHHCDAAGRHSLARIIRLTEARAVVDGDLGLLKLADGRLQAIESDRIRNPEGLRGRWVHGVKIDAAGRALAYALHRRGGRARFEFERTVPGGNLLLHGYYERFDQVRGISPFVAALNSFRDVYENFDLALAKAKVAQLFALKLKRRGLEAAGQLSGGVGSGGAENRASYSVDFGKGPTVLDLEPEEDAEFLESQHPSNQLQDFTRLVVMAALKALDIPFSFFDESHTNFFGSRGAWMHYERSCQHKRDALVDLLDRLTIWRLQLALLDGELELPSGLTLGDLVWEWVPAGMPWWDPAKEIRGDLQAIGSGLDNPQRICRERGRGDFFDNIDLIGKALEYARSKGVPLSFDPGQAPLEVVHGDSQ